MEIYDLGFYKITLIDVIDALLVGIIIYQLFKLLKGSLAFSILTGLITIYLIWLIVRVLNMHLLAGILGEFTKVGVLAVLIVFQQEIRKFLLVIGRNSILGENKRFEALLPWNWKIQKNYNVNFEVILNSCQSMAETQTGALIVLAKTSELKFVATSGEQVDALVSQKLIECIFNKNCPLHDGAIIIANNRIKAAGVVLPVTENTEFSEKMGLRHRSAIGMTEHSDAIVIVVSEETGRISVVKEGVIYNKLSNLQILEMLQKEFGEHAVKVGKKVKAPAI